MEVIVACKTLVVERPLSSGSMRVARDRKLLQRPVRGGWASVGLLSRNLIFSVTIVKKSCNLLYIPIILVTSCKILNSNPALVAALKSRGLAYWKICTTTLAPRSQDHLDGLYSGLRSVPYCIFCMLHHRSYTIHHVSYISIVGPGAAATPWC